VALAARAIGFERVFLDDGRVVFAFGDAFYHARRALWSFLHFPRVLFFDACLNFPDGAFVPHPPLLDWAVAAAARATGSSRAHFEAVAAWSPALLGAAGVVPVAVLGRALRSWGVGLGAAAIYALLPSAINYSRVGNADHHAAAGLLGAALLALYALALDERTRGRRVAAVFAGLCVVRAGMLGVWTGSLLYLAPGEAGLFLASAALRRRDLLGAQAWSAGATAALVAPLVWLAPVAGGGPWSATELSRLHVLAFVVVAALAGGVLALERARPARSGAVALVRAAGLALGLGAALLLVPGVRAGLLPAFAFLARRDAYTELVMEQLPLFYEQGRLTLGAAEQRLAGFAYLVPFVPLVYATLPGAGAVRARAWLLAGWSAIFGLLALQQLRYANDWAAAGAVGAALLLARGCDALLGRGVGPAAARRLAVAAGVILWLPALPRYFVPLAEPTLAYLRGELAGVDRALLSIEGTQQRFAETVAATTPGPGCDAATGPAYGILAHPAMGHALHWAASRATPADPFGPYIGRENYLAVRRFFETASEAEGLALAERLRTPFVLTAEEGGASVASLVQRLHREDGSASDAQPHVEQLRLVAEGPRGGVPMSVAFETQVRATPPYKLWAVVAGALLEVSAAPGEAVRARLPLTTPTGRRFVFEARGAAGADGVARLRVPYPSAPGGPVRARGAWRVRAGEKAWAVAVSERAVATGERIGVGAAR
jgi:dolichyl-diphosphooligosaccharide--protein glycosyltransferase